MIVEIQSQRDNDLYWRGWNEAIEASAQKAYQICLNDLYVKTVGLEKKCAAEIRELKYKVEK